MCIRDRDDRILSCSWHVGYIRHDCDVAGCGIIVVPYREQDMPYAQDAADPVSYTHLDVYKRQDLRHGKERKQYASDKRNM